MDDGPASGPPDGADRSPGASGDDEGGDAAASGGRAADSDREAALVVALVGGSHFVHHMYLVVLPPIFGLLAAEFPVGLAALGLAVGVQGAVNTACQLPFGYLADAYSREAVLAVSLVVGAAGAVLTATAGSYEWLLAAQVVLGVGTGAHHPAHYPLLSAATAPERRGRAYSVHGFAGALGFAGPPAVTSAVVAVGWGWRAVVWVIALVGAAYAVGCLWLVRRRVSPAVRRPPARSRHGAGDAGDPDDTGPGAALRNHLLGGVRSVLALVASPPLLGLVAIAFLASAASWVVRSYAVVLLTDGYGFADGPANLVVTAMFAVSAALILVGGPLTDREGPGPVLLAGFGALAVLAGALAWGGLPVALAVGATVLLAGTVTFSRPARSTLVDALAGRGDVGMSFALVTVGISLGGAVAPPAFGWLIDARGVAVAFGAVAVVAVAAAAVTVVVLRAGDGGVAPTVQPGD